MFNHKYSEIEWNHITLPWQKTRDMYQKEVSFETSLK